MKTIIRSAYYYDDDEYERVDMLDDPQEIAIAAIAYNYGISREDAIEEYKTITEDKLKDFVSYYFRRDIPQKMKNEYKKTTDKAAQDVCNAIFGGKVSMKKLLNSIECAEFEEGSKVTYPKLISRLKELGIDTTKHQYEMMAQRYERYGYGDTYTFKFTAPGDYLAYFAMKLHKQFSKDALLEYIDDYYEDEWADEIPQSLEAIEDIAYEDWWGDGDDGIYYLKNIDTGENLYESEVPIEDEEEYDDDWE